MLRRAHLKLIALHSVRHGIRGGAGLVSLFLTLSIGLILASVLISPLDAVDQQVDRIERQLGEASAADRETAIAEVNAKVIEIAGTAIRWVIDPSADQLAYLTQDKPAIVSGILVLLFLATPLFACLAGFNQTSGDIATRGLRYLLIRTERPNIFLGRFLGTFVFAALVDLALIAILALYMAAKVRVHAPSDMVAWLLAGYLRLVVFSLPYVAVCAWVSCAIESPFGSLVVALMVSYLYPLIIGRGAAINGAVGYAQYGTPWGFKYWLLEPTLSPAFAIGVTAMLGFTAAFLWLGARYFDRRDL